MKCDNVADNRASGPSFELNVYLLNVTELTFPDEGKIHITKGVVPGASTDGD